MGMCMLMCMHMRGQSATGLAGQSAKPKATRAVTPQHTDGYTVLLIRTSVLASVSLDAAWSQRGWDGKVLAGPHRKGASTVFREVCCGTHENAV